MIGLRRLPARMRAMIAGFFILLGMGSLAEAQYYERGPSICVTSRGNCSAGYAPMGAGCYCNIPGFGRKAGNVRAFAGGPPRPRYVEPQPRRYYEDDGYYQPRRRSAMGSVCVTSRGNCSAGGVYPIMSGCYCHIPGFGRKAGNVRY